MIARLKFEPRDLWMGAYVDTDWLRLYICPLPTVVVVIEPSLHGWYRGVVEGWREGHKDVYVREFKDGVKGYVAMCRFTHHVPTPRAALRAGWHYLQSQEARRRFENTRIPF